MIKALCFDFDGTLARFTGDFGLFIDGFRNDLLLTSCDMNRFAERLSQEERRAGPVTLYTSVQAALGALAQRPPDDLGELVAGAVAEYSAQVLLLPGAREVLALCRAHELPLALLTNGPADMQRAAIRAVGLEGYFDCTLISGDADVAVRKPHPRIFELACTALGSPPRETLMVGDSLEADVQGALAAGLQALGIGLMGAAEAVPDLAALAEWLETRL